MAVETDRTVGNRVPHDPVPELPRRRRVWPWALLVVFGVVAGGWWWVAAPEGEATAQADTAAVETAPTFVDVVRTTLQETSTYDGTLGRVTGDPIIVRASGTVTAIPEAGSTLDTGDVLVWIDGEPVVIFEGDVPAWRTMRDDTEGLDVLQLETALTNLGFNETATVTVDEEYTGYTEAMVEDWQEAIGAEVDGVVDFGEVVFLSEPIRIDDVLVLVGSPIRDGDSVVTTSADDIYITFGLPTTQQGVIRVESSVQVEMPDGTDTTATVQEIATVATRSEGVGQATFEVTLVLDDPSVAEGIDQAPVEVTLVTESVEDAVAVPVTALLALVEGGYAVEVDAGGGQTRLVAVEPGFYADGLVEVVSGGIVPGDRVVAP